MVVMAALADLAERVEMTYTDLSPQLIAYGQKTYGKQYPFVIFKQLDIERSIEEEVRLRQRPYPKAIHDHAMSSCTHGIWTLSNWASEAMSAPCLSSQIRQCYELSTHPLTP